MFVGRSWSRTAWAMGAVLALATSAAMATEWNGFRGSRHDGTVPGVQLVEDDSADLDVTWKRAIGSGYSALAIAEGTVLAMFTAGDADVLGAFDVETGEERWRYRIGDTYAGHDGSHDGPISTPLVSGGRVYGLGAWGHLFAVDLKDGKEVWATHLVDDHSGVKPHYGFTTSPVLADGMLVVQLGAEGGAVAGFDPRTGDLEWTLGEDKIDYQSPIVAEIHGDEVVLAAGQKNLWAIDAKRGEVKWSFEHAGDERAMGGATIVPLVAGKNRLFLMNKIDGSVMLEVKKKGVGDVEVKELWSTNSIKSSYVTPVFHEGYIYGMSNRIFTCLDAETGEIAWRSRQPGDGFPTIVGNHLVIITKPGTLHVAKASPESYQEIAQVSLFDDHSWSEVAYAGGHLFARSMAELARIDVIATEERSTEAEGWIADTDFGRFLADLAGERNKGKAIDAFLARQASFPIVEPTGAVHFLYRGDAEDVGIVGDMIGFRREDPMVNVPGTDLFYYSTRLEPNAAVTYGFIPSYGEPVADPMNPQPGEGLFGEVSWFAMPAWQGADFLEDIPEERQGRLVDVEWDSAAFEGERSAKVYLPAGYDESGERRYPVVYVHAGEDALEKGQLKEALDGLIGRTIEPTIGVFILNGAGEGAPPDHASAGEVPGDGRR